MLAIERSRRPNAGNRLFQLLDNEEENEFYKNTYGGFEEEEDDVDFRSDDNESDSVDSDFSNEEADELVSEDDEDAPKPKKRRVVTKSYKEPVREKAKQEVKVKKEPVATKKESDDHEEIKSSESVGPVTERKNVRQSTSLKSAEAIQRRKLLEEKRRKDKHQKRKAEYRHFTQEELLEEAKRTEIINLKSLESYERSELEKKKKAKAVTQRSTVPMIRYLSTSMPCVQEVIKNKDTGQVETVRFGRCARTFITFPDEKALNDAFPVRKRPDPPPQIKCPISNLPARYFDRITKLPFHNCEEFRLLRLAYSRYLDKKGNPKDPEVAAFQEWYRYNKANSPATLLKLGKP